IKVRTINHLRSVLKDKYNEYFLRTTLNNYLLLQNFSSIAAKVHHHPALVAIASVRQFVAMFSHYSVVISQDDKAKVLLGISAVGKTFQTMQTINENGILASWLFCSPQYNVSTSSNTHMADLITLTNQESFNNIFKNNSQVGHKEGFWDTFS
ncbi:9710_t:CDS:2, partial [Gigaspora rosea]